MGLHAAWHLLYDRLACLFGIVAHCASRGHWNAWGRASLAYLTHTRILELAHGPGHLLLALAQAGYQSIGLDRSAPMGRQARRRCRRAGVTAPLVRAAAQKLPFRAGSFDAVVATFPTDYIFDLPTLREAARVTSDRGRLVVVAGAQPPGTQPDPHFVAWLSTQIGQSDPESPGRASAFAEAGWEARIECHPVGESTVFLILAEKVPAVPSNIWSAMEADLEKLTRREDAQVLSGRH
jgi:ubiquinone/menaquinone biosynthesis C-methylase UbiE